MNELSNNLINELKKMLINDEGLRLYPYTDTMGKITIGIGRNLTDIGITENEAISMLENDINKSIDDVKKIINNYNDLTDNRKIVLINMMFNIGLPKFLTFKKMISAIISNDIHEVSNQMLQSEWHDQVGDRAVRLSKLWLNG